MVVHNEVTITATATSPDSWEDAALNVVDRTEATLENIQWAVAQDLSPDLGSDTPQYKTKVTIGFEVR